jgi:hypothetical protein
LHRLYLWTCTVQWAFAVLYTGLTLGAWNVRNGATELPSKMSAGPT